jgi:hypothetical protein
MALVGILSSPDGCLSAAADLKPQIDAAFAEMKVIGQMRPGQVYSVEVAGRKETGKKEWFLRRRTAPEILASGLSCGCGDYAVVFVDLMQKRGLEPLLVDGAALSSQSLESHFSGHAVVAVRRAPGEAWYLADPTNRKILSENWSQGDRFFRGPGGLYWIGYCGPLKDYPAHDAEELKAFYARTLESIPRDFLNERIYRLRFIVDASLTDRDGKYLNPRLAPFLDLQSDILGRFGIHPEKQVEIRLVRGADGDGTSIRRAAGGRWVAELGLQSGCSASLLGYFEQRVADEASAAE